MKNIKEYINESQSLISSFFKENKIKVIKANKRKDEIEYTIELNNDLKNIQNGIKNEKSVNHSELRNELESLIENKYKIEIDSSHISMGVNPAKNSNVSFLSFSFNNNVAHIGIYKKWDENCFIKILNELFNKFKD